MSSDITGHCRACFSEHLQLCKNDISTSGRARYRCLDCGARTTSPLLTRPTPIPPLELSDSGRYVITSATNDCPVDAGALDTLRKYCEINDAQLIVVASVYRNPDATGATRLEQMSWPAEVLPYLCGESVTLGPSIVLRADCRIRVTAINPLAGANHAGDTRSEIYGHPQCATELVPMPRGDTPKMLATTGTISERQYGGSFTAKKAEFHHQLGAILVETAGDRFWVRRLRYDGLGMHDLRKYYTCSGVRDGGISGAVYGDVHVDVLNDAERRQLGRLITGLGAEINVLHDVLDMHTGSHHTEGQALHYLRGADERIEAELERCAEFLESVPNALVVQSNHHDHLEKWFNRFDPRRGGPNVNLYYRLAELVRRGGGESLLELFCRDVGVQCEFSSPDGARNICGVDVSQHGHRGPNGSRGSARSFARTGRKTIIGHSHTPREEKGCLQVGTSGMGHAYASGYSSWMVAHALIYPNGKRTLIHSVDGEWSPMIEEMLCGTFL